MSSIGCNWRLSALGIRSKSHQVCYVLVQDARLSTVSLYPLQKAPFWSFQLRLQPSSWPTYIFLVLQVAPACLPVNFFDFRLQSPAASASTCSNQRQSFPQDPEALCSEGLKFLLRAGGLKGRRGQASAWEAKGRR